MTTIPQNILAAFEALKNIALDDIVALDDAALEEFATAIRGPALMAELQCELRKWKARDIREAADAGRAA